MYRIRIDRFSRHVIHSNQPSIKSYGSLVLLNNDLKKQDVDFIAADWKIPVMYNIEYLKKQLASRGVLNCSYCQRGPLKINEDLSKDPPKHMLATVDHIIPKSRGGEQFDYSNLTVACFKCNMKKGVNFGIKISENNYTWNNEIKSTFRF